MKIIFSNNKPVPCTRNQAKEYLSQNHFSNLFTVCGHAEQNFPRLFLCQGIYKHWDFEALAVFEGSDQEELEKFREVQDRIFE